MDRIIIKRSSLEHIKERSMYNQNFYKFLPNTNYVILEEFDEFYEIGSLYLCAENFERLSFLGCAKYSDWENEDELVIDFLRT